jgi:hypothetical protein
MQYVTEPARKVPVVAEHDVVVLGGGPAAQGRDRAPAEVSD